MTPGSERLVERKDDQNRRFWKTVTPRDVCVKETARIAAVRSGHEIRPRRDWRLYRSG
jgi:hypothetical protein